jgi:hypothetical protein
VVDRQEARETSLRVGLVEAVQQRRLVGIVGQDVLGRPDSRIERAEAKMLGGGAAH